MGLTLSQQMGGIADSLRSEGLIIYAEVIEDLMTEVVALDEKRFAQYKQTGDITVLSKKLNEY